MYIFLCFSENLEISTMTTSTKKPKFGLAWLFGNTGRKERTNDDNRKKSKHLKKEKVIDKRIEPTNLELEGSIGESRISVVSADIKLWNGNPKGKPCTSTKIIKPVIHRLEAQEEDTIELKCVLHDVHHEVDFDKFQAVWAISKLQQKGNDPSDNSNNKDMYSTSKKNIKRGSSICIKFLIMINN